jgi:hypothetical protein
MNTKQPSHPYRLPTVNDQLDHHEAAATAETEEQWQFHQRHCEVCRMEKWAAFVQEEISKGQPCYSCGNAWHADTEHELHHLHTCLYWQYLKAVD